MDELFRLNISRPAEATNAATLPLERRTPLQNELQKIITADPRAAWQLLELPALEFLSTNLQWIEALNTETGADAALIVQLNKFSQESERAIHEQAPAKSIPAVAKLAAPFKPQLSAAGDLSKRLCDLFIALLITRAGGPTRIDQWMRRKFKVGNAPFTPATPLVDFLKGDHPTLNEIAALLRRIALADGVVSQPALYANESQVLAALSRSLLLPPKIFDRLEKPIHAVGVSDLLVVKQHILRYELGEVARIENILRGETRSHTQKHTLSNERETFLETESQTTTEQELTSKDQVSMRNEIENTLKEDTKVDAGLHAQYDGGSFKVQADLTVAYEKSTSESSKSATEIVRDVTERAAKKVTERILQSVRTKVIETFEDTEDQGFSNKAGKEDISGVYQWVDKVYLAQVFNYGKRLLFDLMVPEPAASLLESDAAPLDTPPVRPPALNLQPQQLSDKPSNANYYGKYVALYQATGLEPPPPEHDTVSQPLRFDDKDDDIKQNAQVIRIKEGYAATSAQITVLEHSNDNPGGPILVAVTVGDLTKNFQWPAIGDETKTDSQSGALTPREGQIGLAVFTSDVNALALDVEVTCTRTPTNYAKWQLQAYTKIAAAWRDLENQYQTKVANAKTLRKDTGVLASGPLELNRQTERNELKRGCIAILDNGYTHTAGFNSLKAGAQPAPPQFYDPALPKATEDGVWVRWFEQAFEWEHISYVFYPYFWGRSSKWLERLQVKVPADPLFENFMRAGYARVVVPVRKGFEGAVNFFLLTGRPWMGANLPSIGDKTYLPITEEIKEQTGAPGNEKPVGQPWEVRLPTRLVKLRTGNEDKELPRWERQGKYPSKEPVGAWSWETEI